MNFESFWKSRYHTPPYDLSYNLHGFNREQGSDISAHLPLLEYFATQCKHITEFGTRECYSTSAFIKGCKGQVISYDINTNPNIDLLKTIQLPCQWEFVIQDTINPNFQIEPTDLLFVDTEHTYQQVKMELKLHAKQAQKYIIFHDTFSFPEINKAIDEFLNQHQHWHTIYKASFNHGIRIIEWAKV